MGAIRVMGSLAAAAQDADPRAILLPCVALALVALGIYEFRSWYRLRHIPGPFLASISGAWMVKKALSGRFHEHLKEVSEKYGMSFLRFCILCLSFWCVPTGLTIRRRAPRPHRAQ